MKKFTIYALAPALALFALGCSSPTAMQSTEYDDMYYSSSDETTYSQPQETSYAGLAESGTSETQAQTYSQRNNSVTDDYYADEYYDGREYNPRDNWYRPNYSYIDPYWGSAYTPRHYAYSRPGSVFYDPFYDPFFYDPFYDPFFRRPYWNSGISVIISYNYGWGNWGRPFSPYYSRWYPHHPYYNGFYGGFYGNNWYGNNWYGNRWVYDSPIIVNRVKTQYGPRDSRGAIVTDGNRGNGGRPVRGEAFEGDVKGSEYARPSRPSRGSEAVISPQTGSEAKPSLPARPSRTEYYDPSRGRDRGTRQPINVGEQQQGERRVIQPTERRTREYTPTQRSSEGRIRTREYNVPQQQERQRSIERRSIERRPTYEPRRESPAPSRSSEIRRESSSSSSSGNNSGSSSGRPRRGQ